jgi:5-methylcytosine-specific restriction protein A
LRTVGRPIRSRLRGLCDCLDAQVRASRSRHPWLRGHRCGGKCLLTARIRTGRVDQRPSATGVHPKVKPVDAKLTAEALKETTTMPRAPGICAEPGCGETTPPGVRRCVEHSPNKSQTHRWPTRYGGVPTASSQVVRSTEWKTVRAKVLLRDSRRCQIRGPRCTVTATDVDHVKPVSEGGTDDMSNLQAACRPCHNLKTAQHARASRP